MTSHPWLDDPDARVMSAPPGPGRAVLVDLDVLIAPADEEGVARAVRASVASVAGGAVLGPVRWVSASGGEDLVRQWSVEQHGAPLAGRRVQRLTMEVRGQGVGHLVREIAWAAIDAVCPTAREEERRLTAGERPVPALPDRYPWSGGAHVVDEDRADTTPTIHPNH